MPRQESLIRVEPAVLRWIIDSSGWETEELAEKMGVSAQTIQDWKTKSVEIQIKKLEKLSKKIQRPLALFFLNTPPAEPELTDYRRLPNDKTSRLSRDTITIIRNARYHQSIAGELLEMQGIKPQTKINTKVTIHSSPEESAKSERKKLGFESEDTLLSDKAKRSTRDFYNILRQQIESCNIFVFQGSMPIQEIRGLTLLSDGLPQVIVINAKDTVPARIISLLHEYGHVLLQKDGMCGPQDTANQNNQDDLQQIESWCNRFAASALMPDKESLDRFERKEPSKENSKRDGKGVDAADTCIDQRGQRFISLVLESKENNAITNSDVIDYLDLSLKHMKKLYEKIL